MIEYLHPIFASNCVPFLISAFLLEIIAYFGESTTWRKASTTLVCISALISFATYYTGFMEFSNLNLNSDNQTHVEIHQNIAKIFLISLVPTTILAILRNLSSNEIIHWIFIPFFVSSIIIGTVTSHKGGMLVFKYAIGVNN